jgi:hypothetical protein
MRIQKQEHMFFAARKMSVDFPQPAQDRKKAQDWNQINDAAQKGDAKAAEKLLGLLLRKPAAYGYNMVLNAWSKDQSAEAPQRAETILATMWEKFESGELEANPDVVSYGSVIKEVQI